MIMPRGSDQLLLPVNPFFIGLSLLVALSINLVPIGRHPAMPDLLAVVQKLEESIHAAPTVEAAETAKIPAVQEFDEAEWKAEAEAAEGRRAPEMPAEVASAPLLGLEHLGAAPEPAATPAATAGPIAGDDLPAEIPAFDGIVKEPVDAIAIVGIIFRGVDATLGGNTVGPARTVLKTKTFHPVTQLGQSGGCGGAR